MCIRDSVDSVEQEVDPVGACIGARGARIQQVVNAVSYTHLTLPTTEAV